MNRLPEIAILLIAAVTLIFEPAGKASARDLIADLSSYRVDITTGFTGAGLLLFGAVEEEGDIVVTVSGPRESITVRRKERVAGIWMNTRSMHFNSAPNFYAVAATRPLEEIAPPEVLARQQIGVNHLRLRADTTDKKFLPEEEDIFRAALVRQKQTQGLYAREPGQVTIIAGRLFRTRVHFPANLATGAYTAAVYLIRKGRVVHAQTTPLLVQKVGVGAEVYTFAHERSALYGLVAVFIAIAAGWLAAIVFRKV